MYAHRISCRKKTILQIHQTGFYMEVPEHECVWFNLLLKPRTPEHLLKILKEKRCHERTKQASSPTPLWWSLVVDMTTWRTCLHQTVPRAQDPSRRTTATTMGHATWSIRLQSLPCLSACNKWLKLLNGWECHPHDNERWSGAKSSEGGNPAYLITS